MNYLDKVRTVEPTEINTEKYYAENLWGEEIVSYYIPFTDDTMIMNALVRRVFPSKPDGSILVYPSHTADEATFEVPDEYRDWLLEESNPEVLAKAIYNLAVFDDIADSITDYEQYVAVQELLNENRVQ